MGHKLEQPHTLAAISEQVVALLSVLNAWLLGGVFCSEGYLKKRTWNLLEFLG